MRFKKMATMLGAAGLIATPIMAQATVAPQARTGASVEDSEEMGGRGSGIIIAVLAAAAIIGGIVIAVDNDDEDEPISP